MSNFNLPRNRLVTAYEENGKLIHELMPEFQGFEPDSTIYYMTIEEIENFNSKNS